jgi:hypothetical protein
MTFLCRILGHPLAAQREYTWHRAHETLVLGVRHCWCGRSGDTSFSAHPGKTWGR